MRDLETRLLDMFNEAFAILGVITRETSMADDIGADEMELVELCMEIERTFSITINEDDWIALPTVGAMIDHIKRMFQ